MTPGKAYTFLALSTVMWAGNAVAGRLAIDHVSPMLLANLRWVIATVILLVIGLGQLRSDWNAMRPKLWFVAILGALGFAGFNLLFYAAANHTEATNLSLVQAGIPVAIFVLSFLIFRQKTTVLQLVGFTLSIGGVAVAASRGDLANLLHLTLNYGDALMLIAVVLYGGYAVALRFKPQVHWKSLMLVMSIAAFVVTLPFVFSEYRSGTIIVPDMEGWLVVLYTGVFPAILAQVFFIGGIEIIGANRAGIFVNLVPVVGTILAVIVLREILFTYHLVALAMVICGIALAETSGRRAESRLAAAEGRAIPPQS